MARNFDLVVIGTGTAASVAASRCRSAGWQVAVIDSRPFGGTCALRGCDPKKVLVGAADVADWVGRMQGKGIRSRGVKIDWPELMRFKKSFTDPVPERREESFARAGIARFHGRARFIDGTSVQVDSETLSGGRVLIATGAHPTKLNIEGEEHLTASDEFLDLEKLPKRIIFVGGGYISFEFAHVAARAGARVKILHRGERPLVGFDPDLVDKLVEASRAIGIDIRLRASVEAIEKRGRRLLVHATSENGAEAFEADLAVHGAGRVPEIEDLDLDRAGVRYEKRGVSVNRYLQSVSNPAVYAAGDAAASPGLPLTPVASMEARVAAANLLEGNRYEPDYRGIPTVVFTVPPLASVGLQEAAARARGLRFRTSYGDTSRWYSSRRIGIKHSGYKVLIEEETHRVLGAHLLGSHAEESINLFALAIRFGLTAENLKEMRYSYPSHCDDVSYML